MKINEWLTKADEVIQDQTTREMFKKCFMSTLETSIRITNGRTYIITGDINAMWLRDSSCQVQPYLYLLKENEKLQSLIKGLIRTQIDYAMWDPYANAFLDQEDVPREHRDTTMMKPYVWERKFELDSLCYPVRLAYEYYCQTGDETIFDDVFLRFIHTLLNVLETEQYHSQRSTYTFEREMARVWDLRKTETLQNHGHGFDTRYTGMIWSAFRPSDDACALNYNIPGNMFCSVILSYLAEITQTTYRDPYLVERINDLKFQIDYGIELFGVVLHPRYGKIYAYETDGYGNHILMDDANVPSLLSIPYLGYKDIQDEIYQNTRRFILSEDNPYYFKGTCAQGIGSAHTKKGYVWPIALTMQALTTQNQQEVDALIEMIVRHTANTGFCHESFDVNDDKQYTRAWFCWANALFAELIMKVYLL